MSIQTFSRSIARTLHKNTPVILTGMAVGGLVTTVYLALQAKPVADQKIFDASYNLETEEVIDLTTQEKFKLVWKDYAPVLVSGVFTASCIIGIHSVHSRRAATMLSLYSLTESAFKEYKDKVVETFGEKKEEVVRETIAKDRIEANPADNTQVIITGKGEQLCYDMYSGRYFRSDIETIRKSMNDLNQEAIHNFYVPLNMFYSSIGLPETRLGDEVGFNSNNLMEIKFTSHLNEEGQACLAIDFDASLSRDYDRFH